MTLRRLILLMIFCYLVSWIAVLVFFFFLWYMLPHRLWSQFDWSWLGRHSGFFSLCHSTLFNTFALSSISKIESYFARYVKTKFTNVFTENLGCCTKAKTTLKLKPNVRPIFRPKRPVSYAALDLVEKELNHLQPTKLLCMGIFYCGQESKY